MESCSRCAQIVTSEDYHARGRGLGSPGLHVRRWLCGCGCKRVQFYTVMNVFRIRSSDPYQGRELTIPLHDFPIFKGDMNVNA